MRARKSEAARKSSHRLGYRRSVGHKSPAMPPHSLRPTLEALEGRRLLTAGSASSNVALTAFAASSLAFEPNVGQTDASVQYLARGEGYALFLTDTDAVLRLSPSAPAASGPSTTASQAAAVNSAVDIGLVGANPQPQITPLDPLASVTNYIGSDPSQSHAHVANYARVAYHDVYPGIDLVCYGTQGQLEYDFVVAPGADPSTIALNVQGANGLALDGQGNLVIHTSAGDVTEHAPVVYQEINGVRQPIDGHYVLSSPGNSTTGAYQVHFQVGAYDPSVPLTIDPILDYSTYFGGNQDDAGNGIAVDASGNVYVTGYTDSSNLPPLSVPGYQKTFSSTNGASEDAFVLKLNPAGQPVYFTYLGGNEDDTLAHPLASGSTTIVGQILTSVRGRSIAVDSQGRATVVGDVEQAPGADLNMEDGYQPFPTTANALQPAATQGQNGFLTRLTPDGSQPDYSTFINGASVGATSPYNEQVAMAVASGPADAVYATGTLGLLTADGETSSQTFLVVINGDGSTRWNNIYPQVANPGVTHGLGIAVDTSGNAYITGSTNSLNFATKKVTGVTNLGGFDAYVLKVNTTATNPATNPVVYATRLGGGQDDVGLGIAVDSAGDAYVTGYTGSTDFPTVNAFQSKLANATDPAVGFAGTYDAFVTKLDPTGTNIVYSTYLGGKLDDEGNAIAVDSAGDAWVVGVTDSTDFPLVSPLHLPGGHGDTYGGGQDDAFITEFDPTGQGVLFSTYLGGGSHVFNSDVFSTDAGADGATSVALDKSGNPWVTGYTGSSDFPTAGNPWQPKFGGGDYDGFIARLAPPLLVAAQSFTAQHNVPFSGIVANFTSPETNRTASDFSATIDWGDGDTSAGVIFFDVASNAAYGTGMIQGSHTYTKVGAFPVTVTMTDNVSGQTAQAAVNVSHVSGDYSSPTIAVDPNNGKYQFMAAAGAAGLFAATSDDDGFTWDPVDVIDDHIAQSNGGVPPAFGFPQAIFDNFGNLFLTYIGGNGNSVIVLLSQDLGQTFSVLLNAPFGTAGLGIPELSTGPLDAQGDRETWLVFRQKTNDVIDVTAFTATPWTTAPGTVTQNTFPGGANYLTVPNSSGARDDTSIAVGPANQVLVAFRTQAYSEGQPIPNVDTIWTSLLPAGSTAFAAPTFVTEDNFSGTETIPADKAEIGASISIAFDRADDPYSGRAYLVYTANTLVSNTNATITGTNIFLSYSDNGGASWSAPVAVNDDQGPSSQGVTHFHFLPSIAVDNTATAGNQPTGDVAVGWYDTRNDPNNIKTQFFVAISGDGGQTFSASRPVSPDISDATSNQLSAYALSNQYGQYSSIAFADGIVSPAWVDDSPTQDPSATQFNVVSANVAVANVKVASPTLSPAQVQLQGTEGTAVSGTVATINDPEPTATADEFTNVQINWGDGTDTTPGTVVQAGAAGTFQVMGTHAYARYGVYPISVSLHDNASGADVSLSSDLLPALANTDENSETIAVDPTNRMRLFIASSSDAKIGGLYTALSDNGGLTWNTRPMANGSDGLPAAYGYPKAVFDEFGDLFLSYNETDPNLMAYVESIDGGQTFTKVTELPSGFSPLAAGPVPGGPVGETGLWEVSKNNAADQISALPFVDSLTVVTSPTGGKVEIVPSTSGSSSFTPAIAVGPAGQTLVAFQKPSGTTGVDTIYTSLNTDGATFGPSQAVTDDSLVGQYSIPAQSTALINSGLALAWDTSKGPYRGRVYLVYDNLSGSGTGATAIELFYSDNNGAKWQGPVTVSDNPAGTSAFLPSLAVDPITGNVAVGWYDTRVDPTNNVKAQYYVATSGNGGRSFSPGFVVSTAPSDATVAGLSPYALMHQYGYYSGLAYQGGVVYPAWADDSSSLNTPAAPPHFDPWVARLGTAIIADAPLSANGNIVSPTENATFTGTVATFTDANPNAVAGDFTATIDWGDGSTSTVPGPGTYFVGSTSGFSVGGTHTYTDEGIYSVKVSISDSGGATASASSTANVKDPPPQPAPQQAQFTALQNVPTGMKSLALFTFDGDDESAPGENNTYHYSIDWGDGTSPDTGTAAAVGSGVTVRASHAFTTPGTLHPIVTLTDAWGQSGTATATAVVSSDVTGSIGTDSSGLTFNAQTQLFYGQITITNTGAENITGPLPVVVSGLPAGVTLADAAGTDGAGDPYLTAAVSVLSPGQSTSINVQFSDPSQAAIDYTVDTFDPTPPSPVQLVSVTDPNLTSASGDGPSENPSVSADGRYVAFFSGADNLLVNNTINSTPAGGSGEIYVRDTVTGKLTLASVGNSGAPAKGLGDYNLSPDGRYLLFNSSDTNLAPNVTAPNGGTYLRDLVANTTSLLSVDANGNPTTDGAFAFYNNPFSADSRYVVFLDTSNHSPSTLVTNDKVGGLQVFVRDLQTGTTTLVTVNASGTDAGNADTTNGYNFDPTISADGRYVAFESDSTNLVTNDTVGGTQVFVRDMQQGVTTMVSVNAAGTDGGNDPNSFNSDSEAPQISADGGTVVFQSVSTNLLSNVPSGVVPNQQYLYARNLQTNATSLVSVDPNGIPLAAPLGEDNVPLGFGSPAITPDGRYIAFEQGAQTSEQTATGFVYVRDVQAGKTALASVNAAGTANGNQGASGPLSLSADGRFVLFSSSSTDLVSNDHVGGFQWFVRDLQQNQTTLVSVNRDGTDAGDAPVGFGIDESVRPAFSSDGRFVTFESDADNLVAGDYNFAVDIFQRDLQAATTLLVSARDPNLPSVTGNNPGGNLDSRYPSVSADGRYVAFASRRPDLLPNPLLNQAAASVGAAELPPDNIYVRDLQTGTTTLVSVGLDGQSANSDSTQPVISANGRYVLFFSRATNLTSNPTGNSTGNGEQLFVRDLVAGTTTLVSVNLSGAWCDKDVDLDGSLGGYQPTISDDGRYVAFESTSDDLTSVSNVSSSFPNVYIRDLVNGTTTLASISADGSSGANYGVDGAQISGNGAVVVFYSISTNLVNGVTTPNIENVFVRNLQQGTTSLVNVNTQGTADDNGATALIGPDSISDDGRYVAFVSGSTDLVPAGQQGLAGAGGNIFLRDLVQGTTTLVTTASSTAGTSLTGVSGYPPLISANGEAVAFIGANNALYEWNRATGSTTLVSATTSGQPAEGITDYSTALSADGRFVLFDDVAGNLVASDTMAGSQLYLRDVQQGVTTLVSRAPDGSGANNGPTPNELPLVDTPALSADGSTAVFAATAATNLVPDVFNWDAQVYAYQATPDLPLTAQGAAVSATENGAFQGLVATFVDADPTGVVGDYSATIDWGDGTSSAGSVAADSKIAGQFDVSGSHTYAEEGAYAVVATIFDPGRGNGHHIGHRRATAAKRHD
jgi:hypothetical protein